MPLSFALSSVNLIMYLMIHYLQKSYSSAQEQWLTETKSVISVLKKDENEQLGNTL